MKGQWFPVMRKVKEQANEVHDESGAMVVHRQPRSSLVAGPRPPILGSCAVPIPAPLPTPAPVSLQLADAAPWRRGVDPW